MRADNRTMDALRPLTITPHINPYAEGSCLVAWGNTHIHCTASVEERVPPFMRGKGEGWVTAEYAMLPRATHGRSQREVTKGKPSGRTSEIQRLIGRSLRSVVDMKLLGERQITLDCDVLRADGGTRTASITGAYVAMAIACNKLLETGKIKQNPLRGQVAAVSCGVVDNIPRLDLMYVEDSAAQADVNFVLSKAGGIIEIQGTAEDEPFSEEHFNDMFALAKKGVQQLFAAQDVAIAAPVLENAA